MRNEISGLLQRIGRRLGGHANRTSHAVSDQPTLVPEEQAPVKLTPVHHYGGGNLWEIPVQLCAGDSVPPDGVILDVGGNIGGLAVAFSNIVPDGHVYSFEPNPELWSIWLGTIELNGVSNATLVPLACFTETGRIETFYSDPSFYKAGSRLGHTLPGARKFSVTTISLDDFCSRNSIVPTLIKIDVEGAEALVLRSARKTIDRCRPAIIFEYFAGRDDAEMDSIAFLTSLGYRFYDVNTYDEVDTGFYLSMQTVPLVNVLAVPAESAVAARYAKLRRHLITTAEHSANKRVLADNITLGPGRFVISVDFEMPQDASGALCVRTVGGVLAYYGGTGRELKGHGNSNLVVELTNATDVVVELQKNDGTYDAWLKRIEIRQLSPEVLQP